ncbi:hypothetical protein SISSUDRAFT_1043807 [Sistotremastrum suecicum HHB10207 ss-3]|uniref:Protein BIG1 n=1 Tax=Sistotremastrum suecicum HHB10207 ss-3 TaxID=1314776 RepID=A0A166FIU0_9AGAM|nr:hypothetical protein SISSUDRAFT_1043807 [Sistotremastrum suecicum HHB10207 ss-3]
MRSAGLLAFVSGLVSTGYAFSNTHPLVAWSSQPSRNLAALSSTESRFAHSGDIFGHLLNGGDEDICQFDAVIVTAQPGLHATDLRKLSKSSSIPFLLNSSSTSIQLPYVRSLSRADVEDFAKSIGTRCGAVVVTGDLEDASVTKSVAEDEKKRVFCMCSQAVESEGRERDAHVSEIDALLGDHLNALSQSHPNQLVVVAGTPALHRRQLPADSAVAMDEQDPPPVTGGLLKRYQFLTPALITSLLIVLFIFVPMLFLGINALAGIQSPLRSDNVPKGVGLDKKNQ